MPAALSIPRQFNLHKLPLLSNLQMCLLIQHDNFLFLRLINLSEMNVFLQTSIFAGARGINASTVQKKKKSRTRQNVQTLYLAWKETKDTALLRLQKQKEWGEFGLPQWKLDIWVAPLQPVWGWQSLSLDGEPGLTWIAIKSSLRAFGRGTDRNCLAEKAQSNPVRHNILRRGVLLV